MIVLDTNVVSEVMGPSPDPAVAAWVLRQVDGEVVTTAVTLAEILYGIDLLDQGRRKVVLNGQAARLFANLPMLEFDDTAAVHYAEIMVGRRRLGRPISAFDAQIAAICRVHGATLATRNIRDFEHTGVGLINPWSE